MVEHAAAGTTGSSTATASSQVAAAAQKETVAAVPFPSDVIFSKIDNIITGDKAR